MRLFAFDRLDLYTLRLFAGPLALALLTLLLAQLLERVLRLFDLATSAGAGLGSVLNMAANLVPHYLGLALPMGFTAAIFMAAARMCDDNELDVMLATGRSIARIAAPYFVLAVLLSLFNLYLFGQLQPMTRYGYHVAVHEAMQAGWDARVRENRFVDTGEDFVFTADEVSADGRSLRRVFVHRGGARDDEGAGETTMAASGRLVPAPQGEGLLLRLEDGLILREDAGGRASTLRFGASLINHDFSPRAPAYRERGRSVRERTLPELWRDMRGEAPTQPAAEFHGRLVRALVLPLLPLLALPLGMASKRGRRAPGVVFATLALLALNHALQFGESLAESGRVAAAPALWTPFVLFGLLSVWIFRGSLAWPGDNPVSRAVIAIEGFFEGARPRRRRAASRA